MKLTEDDYGLLKEAGLKTVLVQKIGEEESERSVIMNTLRKDPSHDEVSALAEVYQQIRTGEMPDMETARQVLERLFFSDKKYDLGEVGRYRLNKRLKLDVDPEDAVPHQRRCGCDHQGSDPPEGDEEPGG
jgi:DNA-directed RNA polymerase subunit beta